MLLSLSVEGSKNLLWLAWPVSGDCMVFTPVLNLCCYKILLHILEKNLTNVYVSPWAIVFASCWTDALKCTVFCWALRITVRHHCHWLQVQLLVVVTLSSCLHLSRPWPVEQGSPSLRRLMILVEFPVMLDDNKNIYQFIYKQSKTPYGRGHYFSVRACPGSLSTRTSWCRRWPLWCRMSRHERRRVRIAAAYTGLDHVAVTCPSPSSSRFPQHIVHGAPNQQRHGAHRWNPRWRSHD